MTDEEKQLLLKDLLARLPYGVNVFDDMGRTYKLQLGNAYLTDLFYGNGDYVEVPIRPYLRTMSSMTEEEKRELSKKYVWYVNCGQVEIRYHSDGYWDDTECSTSEYLNLFDWLNVHHFDYLGLIPLGLALEAPEGMYK